MDQRPKYKTWNNNYIKNIGNKLMNLDLREGFMNLTWKARELKAKINEWDCIKLKSFCTEKETANKTNRQPTKWEKIFTNNSFYKGSIYKIHKELIQLNRKQTIQLKKNWQNTWTDSALKETYKWLANIWKRYSTSLAIWKFTWKLQWDTIHIC